MKIKERAGEKRGNNVDEKFLQLLEKVLLLMKSAVSHFAPIMDVEMSIPECYRLYPIQPNCITLEMSNILLCR